MVKNDEIKLEKEFEISSGLISNEGTKATDEFIYYWNHPSTVFPIIVPFLEFKEYNYNLIKGLVVSVGGLTESTIKHSLKAFYKFILSLRFIFFKKTKYLIKLNKDEFFF